MLPSDSLQKLPSCVKCGRPLVEVDAFLLLSCEDVICSTCTKINKRQAFCPRHEQQSLGEFLESAVTNLRAIRDLMCLKTVIDPESEAGQRVERLIEDILRDIRKGRDTMGKFRTKSQKFHSDADRDPQIEKMREKYRNDYDFKDRSVTDPVGFIRQSQSEAKPEDDNLVVCKICFRYNADDAKVCGGCRERDFRVVWRCRRCNTRNPIGTIHCQQCFREDEFQAQVYRKRQSV